MIDHKRRASGEPDMDCLIDTLNARRIDFKTAGADKPEALGNLTAARDKKPVRSEAFRSGALVEFWRSLDGAKGAA